MVGSLAAQLPLYLGGNPAPADVEFECVNKPQYDCKGKVVRAGAKCDECHVRMNQRFIVGARFLSSFSRNE